MRQEHYVGSAERLAERLRELARALDIEEVVILTWAHCVAVRQRSYELLAKEFSLRSQPSADAAE
jgi:alkanesulfonate monooxygenase SsuD/methylene tetrahydromethanopterin reductase-like flavin-dependent oxidoreductase (luciferase family)